MQSEINIGLLGHVDHGKSTICESLTGVWTDIHSMEIKRGITIKLGYADAVFRKCSNCPEPQAFTTEEKCKVCGSPTTFLRKVSFVDAPGHETLMTTVIASASIIDGALLVIAANEKCPQPQTKEHKLVLETLKIKNVIVIQNKIDLVSKEKAVENYNQIKELLKGTMYEDAPIIPVSAHYGANIDVLIKTIEEKIKTPERREDADPLMYVARSFDVNKPGTPIERLVGGVIGGSLIRGKLRVGDEILLLSGVAKEEKKPPEPLSSTITSLNVGRERIEEAKPGGLIGIGTMLDPFLTKADGLVGNVLGLPGKLPPVLSEVSLEYSLFERVDFQNPPIKQGEIFVISVGTTTTLGSVEKVKKSIAQLTLRSPICAEKGTVVALSRRIGQRWRLAGQGKLM